MVVATDIPFLAYSQDCRVSGRLSLDDARLADLLNRSDRVKLFDVTLTSLADGSVHQLDELDVERDELTAVVADGPRGDPARRVRTKPEQVDVLVGGFEARGFLHVLPAGDAIGSFDRRPPMVALTDASLLVQFGDRAVTEAFETLLVNRDLTRSVRRLSPIDVG